ncbi:CU044_5270 family protein [Actinokineospora spheciospongiae]|uniref:CU044_5270 family protein n=1 Tax=Actinokineospora spheciospongiae TaxID=909613 RepID=UPI000D70F5CB|nr:CU044_5270 family protein [Actinokineospora spheciospongiae]PWW52288.1 hypothetical protein DFQ13_11882 [Actinokineospora spheciospongiae]
MDDLTLIRDFAGDAPPADRATLAAARERLLTEAAHPRRTRRLVPWIGGTAVTTAAAVAAVVSLLPTAPAPTPPGVGAPPVAGAPADADPASVLVLAAAYERTQPDVVPRPDQFLHLHNGAYRAWLSIDGTHDGLIDTGDGHPVPAPGCRDGVAVVHKGNTAIGTEPCEPRPAYDPDMPTTGEAMVAHLNAEVFNDPGNPNSVGKDVLSLFESTYLRPPARAALFEAAATLPGLTLADSPPVDGHPAVAIGWSTDSGHNGQLLFDAASNEYLGFRTGNTEVSRSTQTIVDAVGETP